MQFKFCPICSKELVSGFVGNSPREYLKCSDDTCGYVHWDNPILVVAAIVEMPDGVVLVHNKSWPPGMFGLVTGFLEKQEDPQVAVLREVNEELGLHGDAADFIGYYSFHEMNQLILAFSIWAKGNIQLGNELDEFRIVAKTKLKPWDFGTGYAVRDWLLGQLKQV